MSVEDFFGQARDIIEGVLQKQFIRVTCPHRLSATYHATVWHSGFMGMILNMETEDTPADERHSPSNIPHPNVAADYLRENLNAVGYDDSMFRITVNETCLKDQYKTTMWRINLEWVVVPVFCDARTMHLIGDLIRTRRWQVGVKVDKKCESELYKTGQRVVPSHQVTRHGINKSKFQWYFITSYRCGSNGMYRMLRSDDKLVSAANIEAYVE